MASKNKNKGKGDKIVTFAQIVSEAKSARPTQPNAATMNPKWSFRWIDIGSAWCWTSMTARQSEKVFRFLGDVESNTWTEIQQGDKGHPIDPTDPDLLVDAPKRLIEIDRGDFNLYSFRVTGAGRIWGIKDGETYYVLWWDPNHLIYPWEPPNT